MITIDFPLHLHDGQLASVPGMGLVMLYSSSLAADSPHDEALAILVIVTCWDAEDPPLPSIVPFRVIGSIHPPPQTSSNYHATVICRSDDLRPVEGSWTAIPPSFHISGYIGGWTETGFLVNVGKSDDPWYISCSSQNLPFPLDFNLQYVSLTGLYKSAAYLSQFFNGVETTHTTLLLFQPHIVHNMDSTTSCSIVYLGLKPISDLKLKRGISAAGAVFVLLPPSPSTPSLSIQSQP
ncbi:hypothetical protein FRB99_000825 [Tulasnella sp. 403]|nr:hypothetical protein FRB99_000825 [Tulasnella sp. 403]